MKVSALIRHFEDRSSSSFEHSRRINVRIPSSEKISGLVQKLEVKKSRCVEASRRINVHIPSSKKVSGLVKKFEVKTSRCVEASEDSVCSSVALSINSSCSMLKRNAGSSSSIGSLFTAPTYNSDDMSVIGDESVSSSDIEFSIPSCIDVKRIDRREMDSKIDDLNSRAKEYDDFRTFLICLQINC